MPAKARAKRVLNLRREKRERFSPGRILRVILILGVLSALIFASFRLFEGWQKRVWFSDSRLTVVVAREDPTIYSYNPRSNSLAVVKIPKDTQIETAGGYGKWLAGSLWALGNQEGKGGKVLTVSLEKSFGLPIDGWIGASGEGLFYERTLGLPVALWQAMTTSAAQTNLTVFDRLKIVFATSGVGLGDRRDIDLVTQGVVKKTKLPDGFEAFVAVSDRAKTVFELLRDETVFSEGKTLLVINTTEKQGIAGEVARVAGMLGFKVVGIQTVNRDVENCLIEGSKENISSYAAKRLMRIFECESGAETPGPAHLEIILGKGFGERF